MIARLRSRHRFAQIITNWSAHIAEDMKLYALGYRAAYQSDPFTLPSTSPNNPTPTCILHAKTIKVLWISWCDCVIAYSNSKSVWTVQYRGRSLAPAQAEHVANSEVISQAVGADGPRIDFFGSEMHQGLLGYVLHGQGGMNNEVVLFSSDLELEHGAAAVQSYQVVGAYKVVSVRVDSGGGYLVNTADEAAGDHRVIYFESLEGLRKQLDSGSIASTTLMTASFNIVQWVTSSTVATAVDSAGSTYTATQDSRYPKCLGRVYTKSTSFEPVEYLSETCIAKIASGGYMSAAVSSEGELFIWGQGNPGSEKMLCVLEDEVASSKNERTATKTCIIAEDDQDDTVKCLNVMVKGEQARVYDVAMGHGHVLVATEVRKAGYITEQTVQCAGSNGKGQLGFPTNRNYVEHFDVVPFFEGLQIQSIAAAGWSTLVVTSEN
jgi:hypothetical protein